MAISLHDVALAPYFACNDELPADLRRSAKDHLVSLEEELREAKQRVDELKEALAKAQCDVLVAESQVENYYKLVSPLRQLPPEVLARILLFAIPLFPSLPGFSRNDTQQVRLGDVRMVCKKWRNTIDSSPELWRRLWLGGKKITPSIAPSILQRWFSRAGDHDLGLVVEFPRTEYVSDYGEFATFLRSKVWRALTLDGISPKLLEEVFTDDYDCSTLETLRISWVGSRYNYSGSGCHPLYRELPTFLQHFSRLKHLSISWLFPKEDPELFELPFLMDLKMVVTLPEGYIRRLLRGLPSLKNADIAIFKPEHPDTDSPVVDVPLPIERLTVNHRCEWLLRTVPLLEALRLPELWGRFQAVTFDPNSPTSLYRLTNLRLVCLNKSFGDQRAMAFAVSHLPPWVRVVRVDSIQLFRCITRRVAARKFVGRQLDIVTTMKVGEYLDWWGYILKHLVKVFVRKRSGRARDAFQGRDLVVWVKASSWQECGYREEWKKLIDQLRSVNIQFELTMGPRPGDDVDFEIPYV